jgi:hypothetical protein
VSLHSLRLGHHLVGRQQPKQHAGRFDVLRMQPLVVVGGPEDHDGSLLVAGAVHAPHDGVAGRVDGDHRDARHSGVRLLVRVLYARDGERLATGKVAPVPDLLPRFPI